MTKKNQSPSGDTRSAQKKSVKLPIAINKLKKTEYPTKRNNYRRYKNAKWKWEDIFKDIELLKNQNDQSYMIKISQKYNIPYSTLKMK
jgi:hypothetical protein